MSRVEFVAEDKGPGIELVLKQHGFTINRLQNKWFPVTPAQITADQDNYDLGDAFVARLSTDASRTIKGIKNGEAGIWLLIINVGANDLVLADEHGDADAENRIITKSGSDLTLAPNASAWLFYDADTARWRVIAP